ncbi:MAG: hypothetical protein IKF22_10435 [Lachnospiraceae bacterium]|nr:hypothetical protein [Lachnospiraceae bacterium]
MNREEQVLKKSFYALLFSIVLAFVTLVGCSGSSSAVAGGSGKVTLESAPEQTDSQNGTTEESPGVDEQSLSLQSAPEQVAGDTKDEAASGADGTSTESKASSKDEPEAVGNESEAAINEPEATIDENGTYSSKDDVALYIHVYGHLPKNFMTKKEAKKLGWEGGSLEKYAKGMCIGGDHFGNYEGILPQGNYHECDIDTLGRKSRGAKRIIYSDDGRIYYTEDHYETFELLYGEE